ncbi:MAG TPA: LysR family transcriptional regulator, partial [Acidimicrobiales bacterium]|nr:LysR family transcriptional regulator [Acidimicrobiales bacterium]
MSLAQLQTFLAVAAKEHVTRAAGELGLSQPAVSHQLRQLEQALGLSLVERAGRGLRLTQDGRALLPLAAAVAADVKLLDEQAAALRGLMAGQLPVAASHTIGVYRLPAWLPGFLDRYPAITVQVRVANTPEAIARLRRGEVDAAFVEGPDPADELEALSIETDELIIVAGADHPLAAPPGPPDLVSELGRHRYLAREAGSGTEELAAGLLGSAYRKGPVVEFDQLDAVRSAALAGLGFAV